MRSVLSAVLVLAASSAFAADESASFYASMLRRGVSDCIRGSWGSAVGPLRIAAFGLVNDISAYQTAQVYLAVASEKLGRTDEARAAAQKVLQAERIGSRYATLTLDPAVKTAFEAALPKLVRPEQLAILQKPAPAPVLSVAPAPPPATPQQTATAGATPNKPIPVPIVAPVQPQPQATVRTTTTAPKPARAAPAPAVLTVAPATPPAAPQQTTTAGEGAGATPSQPIPVPVVAPVQPQPQATVRTTTTAPPPARPAPAPAVLSVAPATPQQTATAGEGAGATPSQPAPVPVPAAVKPQPQPAAPTVRTTTASKPTPPPARPAPAPAPVPVQQDSPIVAASRRRPSQSFDVAARIREAEGLLNEGRILAARQTLLELAASPSLSRAQTLAVARGLSHASAWRESSNVYRKAAPLQPGEELHMFYEAVNHYELGDVAAARSLLQSAGSALPETREVALYRARIEGRK